jgi:argininosuccinate lyase
VQRDATELDDAPAREGEAHGAAIRAIADQRCAGVCGMQPDLVHAAGDGGYREERGPARRAPADDEVSLRVHSLSTGDGAKARSRGAADRCVPRSLVARWSARGDRDVTPLVGARRASAHEPLRGCRRAREDDDPTDVAVESRCRVERRVADAERLCHERDESVRGAPLVRDRRNTGGLVGGDEVAGLREHAHRPGPRLARRRDLDHIAVAHALIAPPHASKTHEHPSLGHGVRICAGAAEHVAHGAAVVVGAYDPAHGVRRYRAADRVELLWRACAESTTRMGTMGGIARTSATGSEGMLGELLAWSSSFEHDRALVREDLIGSAAHVTMLARTGIVPLHDARALRDGLRALYDGACAGVLELPADEEDVHMAVEAELTRRLGPVAARLHTARSRNDQVALDLRLHVRDRGAALLAEVGALIDALAGRAARETHVLLPAYTHRQRAQPVSAAFFVASWGVGLACAAETVSFALDRIEMPLGSGACSGTSLPIDRALVARLFAPWEPTRNALHTVGDRDFALDWTWSAARVVLALGRIATDVVDFATSEFGLLTLDGAVAAGSSMMPQKKNPDVFELVRGKSARAVGGVVAMLTLMKGLPSGYNRDQQEDRLPLLEAGPLALGCVRAVSLALPHVTFDAERGGRALDEGFTQATDLAEALVKRGVPFRAAYTAVGKLVALAVEERMPLRRVDLARAQAIHPAFDAQSLRVLEPAAAVLAKESLGGTGPQAVDAQIAWLHGRASLLSAKAAAHGSLDALAERVFAEPLEQP